MGSGGCVERITPRVGHDATGLTFRGARGFFLPPGLGSRPAWTGQVSLILR